VNETLLTGQTLTESDLLRAIGTMGADTPEHAVRSAVDFAAHRLNAPVAGWVAAGDPSRLKLSAMRGLPPATADQVPEKMGTLRRSDVESEADVAGVAARFAELAGVERAVAVRSRSALVLVTRASATAEPIARVVRMMLETTLERLDAVNAAERRNQQLDLSMAWTAHEVKSPLAGAMAALERARLAPDQDTNELLERAQRELQQLAELVDDLLNWAVLGEPIQTEPIDLLAMVREAVEATQHPNVQDRVRILAPRSPVSVSASPSHLRGALANVIRNALLYSPSGSLVQITLASRDGLVWITVRDQGPGIPEEEREWIFDPFARGVGAPRGGKGLGLFITRRVIEAHDGAIWFEPSDEGTTFRIRLPAHHRPGDQPSS
jgi:signal transduction histidine kinase